MFLKIEELKHVVIGRIKDAGYNAIQIDCNEWLTLYPQLTDYRIEVISPSGEIYFADTTIQGGVITWKLTARDTFQVGNGQYQVVAVGGNGERKTSSHPKITILEIANGTDADVPPDLSDAWTDTVVRNANAAIDAAEISKQNSEAAIDSANRAIALAEEISEATNRAENAAERAEAAAERAESAGGSGGSAGGIVTETDPTVYDWAKQPQKPTYTADEVNAIGKDALPQAIEAALAQAKENGEFDGAPGLKGDPGKDGGYYQPSVTNGVLTWTPSNANMPSVPSSDVRGPAGQDGQPGAPGKTAYQYAQDGGYTGTEEEFAAKLAEEVYNKEETDAAISEATKEDEYELIETYTVSGSDVASFARYIGLKRVFIEIISPKCDTTRHATVLLGTSNKPVRVIAQYAQANSTYTTRIYFTNENGIWTVRGEKGPLSSASSMFGMSTEGAALTSKDYVDCWYENIYAPNKFVDGTIINLYGVRV